MKRISLAMLLLGATGAGKTPLGDRLERVGWAGYRCHHFDFGDQLRQAAAADPGTPPWQLSVGEIMIVRHSLQTGALLEPAHFGIALKVLDGFGAMRQVGSGDLLLLNGLPRHIRQAEMLPESLRIETVVVLEIEPETVWKRIQRDCGGDRAGRTDDTRQAVGQRLETYRQRTLPLIDYYTAAGACILRVAVRVESTAAMLLQDLKLAGVMSSR